MILRFAIVFAGFFLGLPTVLSAQQNDLGFLDATFKISNPGSTATCFFVETAPNSDGKSTQVYLITAKHVLAQAAGETCKIVSRKRNDVGGFERNEFDLKIRENEKPRWIEHDQHDIAVLAVDLPDGNAIAPIRWNQISDDTFFDQENFRSASPVLLPGFPAQLESNAAGCPVLRQGIIASYPLQPSSQATTFMVSISSTEGDSGAPVIFQSSDKSTNEISESAAPQSKTNVTESKTGSPPATSRRLKVLDTTTDFDDSSSHFSVVGILIGKHRQTTKTVSSFEERTVHQPLGLAIVVPSQLIRETIKKAEAQVD